MIRRLAPFTLAATLALAAQPASAESTPIVVAAGVNTSFDPNVGTLSYAETDAERFANVMAGVGHVEAANLALLRGPTAQEFLQMIAERVRTAPKPARLILYFSGHADDRGMHFRHGPLPMATLRSFLTKLPLPTKVLFVDSCFSGAIAAKGVVPAEPFNLPKLDTDELSGSVFLTASSAREAAYESTQLSGSLFTHYVIAGLSGSADANKDGLVTVEELYQFVYRETRLQSLAYPSSREQHPEYHADLHGRGALVLAKPRALLGTVAVDAGIIGTVRFLSLSGLGSFSSAYAPTKTRTLSLPEGSYRAVIRRGDQMGEASIVVVRGESTTIGPRQFTWHPVEMEVASNTKGGQAMSSAVIAMAALGHTMGGALDIEIFELNLAHTLTTFSTSNSKWTLLTEGSAYQGDGRLKDYPVSMVGGRLGMGIIQAWTAVAMRASLGANVTHTTQSFRLENFAVKSSETTSPGAYAGLLFPVGRSLIGQFNLTTRLNLSPMRDLDGAVINSSQYLIGLEMEP